MQLSASFNDPNKDDKQPGGILINQRELANQTADQHKTFRLINDNSV